MARQLPTREEIVDCLHDHGRAIHPRALAKKLAIPQGSIERLQELLDQLCFEGTLKRLPGQRFRVQSQSAEQGLPTWEGVLSVNPRGFGFVTAVGHDDVYLPPTAIGGALHGDRVTVQVTSTSRRGVEGRVMAVVARRNPRVAGLFRKRGKSAWLEPDDTRVRGPIVLTAGLSKGKDGDAAVARIVRFPENADENPEGELVAVLGEPGTAKAEVAKILVREQIEEEHPRDAIREGERMAARLGGVMAENRVDLRHVPLPTIDPEDARDHDDAIWVERTEKGYRAWVAIADVSEYVQPESALDKEAATRGCTIYLPDRAIPMLPSALAADLCSLLPDHDRLCLCVIIDLDRRAEVVNVEVVEGLMRSAAMLTYGGVARTLGFTDAPPLSTQAESFKRNLKSIDELARKLRRRRMDRGALALDLPEPKVTLDPVTGIPTQVTRRAEDPGVKRAYEMVEEMMLLANEVVAQWLSKRRCPTIYRVHGKPDEKKLERLGEIAHVMGVEFDLEEMQDAVAVSQWLVKVQKHPRGKALEMLLLRSLKQAVYDIVNIGHFGLASESYLHFTSPIRRYPDLLVHRSIKHILRGGKPDTSTAAVELMRVAATTSSTRERAAVSVEREVLDLYRALFMRDHIGEVFEGRVSAIVGGGAYVTLGEPFVDVLVRFESMGPDRYETSEDELSLVGLRSGDEVRLGDAVTVTIEDVAILRRTVYAKRIPPAKVADALAKEVSRESGPPPGKMKRVSRRADASEHRGKGRPVKTKQAEQAPAAPRQRGKPAPKSRAGAKHPPAKGGARGGARGGAAGGASADDERPARSRPSRARRKSASPRKKQGS